jgi:hypothetical protein
MTATGTAAHDAVVATVVGPGFPSRGPIRLADAEPDADAGGKHDDDER